MQLREATADDLPAILAIYNDAVLRSTATADYEPQSLPSRRQWWEKHRIDELPVLVAAEGDDVIAWGSLSRYHARPGYRFTVEDSLYVAERARRRGVGRKLLVRLVDDAQRLGYRSVVASIDGSNQASLKLHAELGFEPAGRLRQAIYKFDTWLDVVYLQRFL
jgi:phosphinothricin acetyltransferase